MEGWGGGVEGCVLHVVYGTPVEASHDDDEVSLVALMSCERPAAMSHGVLRMSG